LTRRPLIGVTLCSDERGRWRAGRTYHYLAVDYLRALALAGADAVYVPAQPRLERIAERLDGLLIPGGDDFAPPAPYPPEVAFELVPDAQLAADRALLECVLARGRPVLGICYGAQLLALQRGGALHYHLPVDVPSAGPHTGAGTRHALAIEPGTRLARALGGPTAEVNSQHHQAIRSPGPELRVSARAADGVIEAVESPGDPWCLGVQWHPELQSDAGSQALFAQFVAAAAK